MRYRAGAARMVGERGEEVHTESSYHNMDFTASVERVKPLEDAKDSYDLFHTF